MTTRKPLIIGPFSKGLNTYDDPTAIQDTELVEALNFDPGFDGSLRSRPPFSNTNLPMTLGPTGTPRLLGYFYDNNNIPYLIASDGLNSTWRFASGAWALITNTFAATDMAQFDGKAWLLPPVGETDPGGYWNPTLGFVADSDMPKGTSITSYKSRLWVAEGVGGPNPTRIRYSKVLGQPSFWASASFLDVGAGDGQSVVKIQSYFDTMLVFRTKSIWSFQYGVDPATAIQGVIVPGVGLQTPRAVVPYESYLYFMYDEKAYRFINNRVEQINIKVPFRASNKASTNDPFHVSLFNNRILYSYYEMVYVYSLRTQTWTTWRSDEWGPIGQVMSSFVSGDTDKAYALPSAPDEVVNGYRTNLAKNPQGAVDTTGYGGAVDGGAVTITRAAGGPAEVGFRVQASVNANAGPGDLTIDYSEDGLTDTDSYSISGWGWSSAATGQTRRGFVQWSSTSGTILRTDFINMPNFPDSAWERVKFSVNVKPPAGATKVRIGFRCSYTGAIAAGQRVLLTGVLIEKTNAVKDYFDGSYPDTDQEDFGWNGTAHASTSFLSLKRYLPFLKIEDRFNIESEPMQCSIQTKNYNFDVPGSYKVLFWWGLDAIFKTNVTAQVSPVLFNAVTMWNQIFTAGKTWGNLGERTWKFPLSEGEVGVTTEIVSAAGPSRKFVKFFKKLRFRQVFFRIKFMTDGSSSSAPVQVFSLSAYMAEKQTVSKQIS